MAEEETSEQTNTESDETTAEVLYDDKGSEDKSEETTEEVKEVETDEKDDTKEAEDKPETEEDKAPEKYDLKLGDDSIFEKEDIERIEAKAKELNLNNEDAQSLLEMESGIISDYHDKLIKQVEDTQAGWIKEGENDKEIGGDNYKESVALSNRVVEKFGSEVYKKMMDDSGYGNHPEVIRIFAGIGKLMENDKGIFPNSHSSKEKTAEEVFYGE
jgi:hypothetical protein